VDSRFAQLSPNFDLGESPRPIEFENARPIKDWRFLYHFPTG
jgi:hypothetical protein